MPTKALAHAQTIHAAGVRPVTRSAPVAFSKVSEARPKSAPTEIFSGVMTRLTTALEQAEEDLDNNLLDLEDFCEDDDE